MEKLWLFLQLPLPGLRFSVLQTDGQFQEGEKHGHCQRGPNEVFHQFIVFTTENREKDFSNLIFSQIRIVRNLKNLRMRSNISQCFNQLRPLCQILLLRYLKQSFSIWARYSAISIIKVQQKFCLTDQHGL